MFKIKQTTLLKNKHFIFNITMKGRFSKKRSKKRGAGKGISFPNQESKNYVNLESIQIVFIKIYSNCNYNTQ